MKKYIALSAIIAAAFIAAPAANAQDDSTNSAAAPAAGAKHHGKGMQHGKVSAVDATAMTVTVGEQTFNITSDTKITKHKEPATISDITVGEMVMIASKKDGDKLNATAIMIGGGKKKKSE